MAEGEECKAEEFYLSFAKVHVQVLVIYVSFPFLCFPTNVLIVICS